jgi:Uncharacterized conserved protein
MRDINKVQLKIVGITYSQVQAGAYALVLAEDKGVRRIPIIIGTPEAQSIAIFLEGLQPPRPLTHDLFISFLGVFHVQLKEIFIYKYEDGVFFSELVFNDGTKDYRIDSRTSDAIAIAIRAKSPIFINEEIMNDVSIVIDDEEIIEDFEQDMAQMTTLDSYEEMTKEELQSAMNEAIEKEDYEKASLLHQLIKKK